MMIQDEATDAELIQRLCEQDVAALGDLFNRYYPQVYRTAAAITRDSAVAEDIAQDCFLRLYQYARRIDVNLPLAPWLYRVTVNLAYTWISRRQKRRISLDALIDRLMSPLSQGPEQLAERGETRHRVREAIGSLQFNQRVVVVLHYLNNLSLEEIAGILECPVGTVKSRLYYARENLRRQLADAQGMLDEAHGYVELADAIEPGTLPSTR
ncbi:MAG: RNA polymerase sigma factor [Chloroflexi bacterium]|nr:RNA polymerase sigma factor [Chloroflexota bacterium]